MTIPKEARARWNAPSHEVSHSAMLLREHTLGHKLSNRPLWSHIQQRLLLHRLSIHRLQSASRCDNNREEITHVQAKIKITSLTVFVMLLFFLFALTAFILVLIGVKQYKSTANAMNYNYEVRTVTSYLREKSDRMILTLQSV